MVTVIKSLIKRHNSHHRMHFTCQDKWALEDNRKNPQKSQLSYRLEWWVRYSDSRKHNGMNRMKSLRPKHLLLHLLIFSFSLKNNIFWEILHFVQQNWRRPCCLPYWLSNREKKTDFFFFYDTIFHLASQQFLLSFSIFLRAKQNLASAFLVSITT